MKSAKQLRDDRAGVWAKQKELMDRAKSREDQKMLPDEELQWDKYEKDFSELSKQIDRQQAYESREAELAAQVGETIKPAASKTQEELEKDYEEVFFKYCRQGTQNLTNTERNVMVQFRGTDPQTTTTTAGGFTIPQGFSNELEKRMVAWGGMLQAARIVRTATGNTVDWPTVDDTAATGAILTEGSADTVNDITFARKQLEAYMYTSRVVKVSWQLLQDSAFDLPSELAEMLGRRLGTITNNHFTTGTGSSQPNGFVTAASVGTTSASNSTVTANELVDLIHSVDAAYRVNGRFMLSDNALSIIKKLNVGSSDARPIWVPSMRDSEPSTIWGRPYTVNYDMASFGAGNKPIAFGDFSKYIIRFAGDTIFLRLDERYADNLLVGFSAYRRADGELIQTNAIKVLRNPTT